MKRLGTRALLTITFLLSFTACSNVIYDDEGDCSVKYRLKFRYDMNMKFADAFANEVKSVNVYAFDGNGVLVWQKSEKGDALATEDYAMTLDLEPGDYQLVAWCGLANNGERSESFTVPSMTIGLSHITDLQCKLNRKRNEAGQAYTDEDLYALFHGALNVNLPSNNDEEEYIYTMPLTKDTHHLRVILQHLSGKNVDADDFSFSIEGTNGWMNYDNSLVADENITYNAWNKESGTAGVNDNNTDESEAMTSVSVAIADLTVARMMADDKLTLTIRNSEGKTVARIPFIDYALLVKGFYNKSMTDQEYLDRQDEYSMTFFLDESGQWVSSSIIINSWRVVLQNTDLQ